ncbi:hypothetical protein LTR84_008366 [Exophiala bonariae]|uniref:Cupin 2 conserved barrel domain-containing protein n=1 Tax=Exophiala bonariae TaxID=1690606 RepID=A0AAV9MWY4_9EURO|nr:hypothetical protein LTR84_008366 [Exophiala bonariae]
MANNGNGKSNGESSYFGEAFTAPGLPRFTRTITGHDEQDGSTRFLVRDEGDHQVVRKAKGFDFEAAQTVLYATFGVPVDLKDNDDIRAVREGYKGGHHIKNGTFVSMLDFSPGAETPMHRGESIDYNVVIEGEFDLVLDSGEVTRMRRGDVNVQRATNHKWVNVSGDRKEPGRLFNVLIDIQLPLSVNGQDLKGFSEGYPAELGYGYGVERHEHAGKAVDESVATS